MFQFACGKPVQIYPQRGGSVFWPHLIKLNGYHNHNAIRRLWKLLVNSHWAGVLPLTFFGCSWLVLTSLWSLGASWVLVCLQFLNILFLHLSIWCFPYGIARPVSELFQKAFAHTHLPSNSGFCWHLWYTLAILTDTFRFNLKTWSTYSTVKCRKLDNLCVFLWPVHIFPWGKLICLQINQYYLLLCPFTWI